MKRAEKIYDLIKIEDEKLKDDFDRIDTLSDVISPENMLMKKSEINDERAVLVTCIGLLGDFMCETRRKAG